MGINAADLQRHRDVQNGVSNQDGSKTENVIKMFGDPEKIAAIKANSVIVKIGNPLTEVSIRPLNPRMGVQAYKLLRTALFPIINLYRKQTQGNVNIMDVLDAFGENVDEIPKLITLILQRGNPQITEEWVLDNVDLIPDLLIILPHFMQQNMFDKLYSPKAPAPPQRPSRLSESEQPAAADVETADSEVSSTAV